MKRLVGIACMITMVAFWSNAQAGKWYAGVKGGVNLGDMSGDDVESSGMRTGIMGGAFLGANFSEQFGGRLEALYVQKGAKEDVDVGGTIVEVTNKLDYIEFPLLFVGTFPAGETFNLSVFAGPTFAFNMSAEAEAETGGTVDTDELVKGFEFGAAIGAGGEIVMSSFSLIFDARYSLGASSIAEDDEDTGETVDIKNRGIGIMVGAKFPLGGN